MIDLSFLTEEEQGAILAVLKRDAELKKAEEHRVQKLQTTVGDRGQLRYLTGEWFYETKQLRHQDRIHGSDIIRASMRHTHKPLTILELSQMLPEQPSFVDSENRDVFVPPVLCGLLEEPHTQRSDERFQNQNPSDPSPHTPKAVLQSPTKRENPFNSELNAHHTFEQQDGQLSDEDVDHSQKLNEAPLPSSDSSISCATNLQPDACLVSQNADSVPVPIPENTAVANSQDCFVEVDGAAGRETNCAAPRGILKHLSTSSSTDSLLSPLDLQSPVSPDSPTETWMDRKQVKFSSMVSQSGEEWQNGKELGEHSLLDNDSIAPSEMENSCLNNSYLDNTDSTATDTQILNQSGVDLQEGGAVRLETEANQREQEAGRHQVLGDVSGHRHSERLNPVLCSPDSAEPGHDSPIVSALKRLSSRMSSSKSLENLTSQSREEHDSRQQMNSSVDDASSLPPPASSLSNSKQMKTSVSVPVLQQDETDSDSTFENNLGRRRNTGSSTSNISLSSGMASMSSVSGSVSSISPADFGDIEVQGNIQLAVNYIQKLGEFHIFVVHCRELAVADSKKNRSDPYVKCYLVPDKTKLGKRKTTVRKKNLNPNYNEILRFKIIMEVLKTERLNVSVWHNDTFGRNSFLGEVDLDLSEWDFSNTQINEYALKARESAQTSDLPSPSRLMDSRGQMRLALRFLPQTSHSKRTSRMETGEVQIWVKDCKSLPSVRGVMIDPFVKCTVLPDRSRKSRQKTRVVKRTANPMFNHTMVYDGFRAEDLREACVEITVWDHDRLNSHYIGGLRLGLGTGKSYGLEVLWMDSTTAEADLWQRMLQSDGEWVEEVLPLRMFVLAKSNSK
ncbi:synaptotagmin-like protein 2 isoform X3 [Scophthalmus maximus]|uniref:synaptotagmin-like protein 2 isoform X3 n=1 Tax=Scophthalmus maximus TaxID=52904 RepID=UPI0015E15599|nr:synaptotagmin-like protein 2 isoform X3 [Scophthalmus maximus]XP_035482479.1 synaptotagmin-like protein 2 isoform X3 [Scophthalmus maximus]